MIKRLLLFVLIGTLLASCVKKKYALLCPGEHKPATTKEVPQKQREAIAEHRLAQQLISENNSQEPAYSAVTTQPEASREQQNTSTPSPKQKTVREERTSKTLSNSPDDDDEDRNRPRQMHRPSLWSSNMFFSVFYLGVFGLGFYFIGLIWSIRNLFYLRHRKDQYTWKALSVTVVIVHMFFSAIAGIAMFLAMGALPAFELAAFIAFGALGILFMLCVLALAFYFGEIEFYSQSR